MKNLIFITVLFFGFVTSASEQNLLGLWKSDPSEKGYSHIQIEKTDGKYFGTIKYLSKPTYDKSEGKKLEGKDKMDKNNPDDKLKSNKIVGLQILKGFVPDGENEWDGGTIYDPNNGKTYKCIIKSNEKDKLAVKGYIGFSFIGRTTTWTRVKN